MKNKIQISQNNNNNNNKEYIPPTLEKLTVKETHSGPNFYQNEDPFLNFYGPIS